jgi:hypothetical protein
MTEKALFECVCVCVRERERERAGMEPAELIMTMFPNRVVIDQ